jgi:pimeloyl-ACP methyl ester carboxylesterase
MLPGASAARAMSKSGKATFVLVHPAWHGAWCWKKVIPLLRDQGHEVHTPTLTGLGERDHLAEPRVGLRTHVEDVVNVLKFEGLQDVILLGHSSAGMVITGVADRVPQQISHLVYLDAFVPQDGEALLNLVPTDRRHAMETFVTAEGDGWLLPRFARLPWDEIVRKLWGVSDDGDAKWMTARLGPTPFGHFRDPVRRTNAAAEMLPRTYIRCLGFAHAGFDRFAAIARKNARWRYRELATSHEAFVTLPRGLVDLLLELA